MEDINVKETIKEKVGEVEKKYGKKAVIAGAVVIFIIVCALFFGLDFGQGPIGMDR